MFRVRSLLYFYRPWLLRNLDRGHEKKKKQCGGFPPSYHLRHQSWNCFYPSTYKLGAIWMCDWEVTYNWKWRLTAAQKLTLSNYPQLSPIEAAIGKRYWILLFNNWIPLEFFWIKYLLKPKGNLGCSISQSSLSFTWFKQRNHSLQPNNNKYLL